MDSRESEDLNDSTEIMEENSQDNRPEKNASVSEAEFEHAADGGKSTGDLEETEDHENFGNTEETEYIEDTNIPGKASQTL